jgi:hypothetical protein
MVLLSGHYFQFREWIKGIMMNCKFLKIIGIGFILSVSTLANATLIDNGDYTTDTVSGLDWLDWTETLNDTQAEALLEFSGDGWRIATSSEALQLMESHFGISFDGTSPYSISSSASLVDKRNTFTSLMGLISPTASYASIEGFGMMGADLNQAYANFNSPKFGSIGFSAGYAGVALVKDTTVNEPAIITIFALGFAGIGFARRRQ